MNWLKILGILFFIGATPINARERRGGDDVGNGGFAYKQSVKILKMAAKALEDKINISTLSDLVNHPERRTILQDTLRYDQLEKISKKDRYRGGEKLAMDYEISPPKVIVLKAYFQAFAGKTDTELEDSSLEVQKRLLHEASHIWGYKEEQSEVFAKAFLANVDVNSNRPTDQITIKPDYCICNNGRSESGDRCISFCKERPYNSSPMLFLETIMGPDILSNPHLGNLYNWCNVQLYNDMTAPQCFLSASYGSESIDSIPVTIKRGSNFLSVNIQSLPKNVPLTIKILEGKTGSMAQSKEVEILINADPDEQVCSEKCPTYSVPICQIFKTGLTTDGTVACALRCKETLVRGQCINSECKAPSVPPVPDFDPNDCSDAVDPQ